MFCVVVPKLKATLPIYVIAIEQINYFCSHLSGHLPLRTSRVINTYKQNEYKYGFGIEKKWKRESLRILLKYDLYGYNVYKTEIQEVINNAYRIPMYNQVRNYAGTGKVMFHYTSRLKVEKGSETQSDILSTPGHRWIKLRYRMQCVNSFRISI